MPEQPFHSSPLLSGIRAGELCIGGQPLSRLAHRAGGTPFYAYDRHAVTAAVERLRAIIPEELHLHYAVKANPMPALVQLVSGRVDGLDVASLAELRLALDAGMAPAGISFAGPGKGNHELRAAAAAGVLVSLESEGEMERLARLGAALGLRPRVAVRVNPDFELKRSGMRMGGGPAPFGVDAERVPAMLERLGALPLDFQGLHIYAGSQNLRAEAIVEAQDRTFDLACRLAAAAPAPVRWLNIGGGFGIPYFPGDRPLDMAPIAANLAARMAEARRRLPEAEVVLELGRYLVGEAGAYVCRVVDRKVSRGRTFLVTDGGMHHHLAASGNLGQVVRRNYPVVVGTRMGAAEPETVTVVGPLCTPLDVLAEDVELPRAGPGDLIAVLQSGAYAFSASPHRFLGHPPPVELLV